MDDLTLLNNNVAKSYDKASEKFTDNFRTVGSLASPEIDESLEFQPLKVSLYELILRQLVDDGLVEVAHMLHIRTKLPVPSNTPKDSLYNFYKTLTFLPMDLKNTDNKLETKKELNEIRSSSDIHKIESILPNLENISRRWIPLNLKSRIQSQRREDGNNDNNNGSTKKMGSGMFSCVTDIGEVYYLRNITKLIDSDNWQHPPMLSAILRANTIISNHRPYCRALCVGPNGMFIATGGADGMVRVVPPPSQIPGSNSSSSLSSHQKIFTESRGIITALSCRPKKDILISGDTDSTLIIYDIKGSINSNTNSSGASIGTLGSSGPIGTTNTGYFVPRISRKPVHFIREISPITCIDVHPCDDYFFVGTQHPILRLYDVNSCESYTSSNPSHQHSSGLTCIKVSNDGSITLTSSDDGSIKLWDSVNLHCVNTIYNAHCGYPVHSLCLSLSQRYMLSCGGDGMGRLWDLRMGKEMMRYSTGLKNTCHSKGIFLVDERYIAITAIDATICTTSAVNPTVHSNNLNSNNVSDINKLMNNRISNSFLDNASLKTVKTATVLDHITKPNPLGDIVIFNSVNGNIVGTIEGIHDAPVMDFELIINPQRTSGISCTNKTSAPSHLTDCAVVTVCDDGKCRLLDLNYAFIPDE
ncbi:hypothetical protein ACR3K2_11400 [Cryptosporidium serpentis]